jgi:hypothetical protein
MFDWLRYRYQLGRLLRKKHHIRRRHGQAWQKGRVEEQPTSEQDKLASLARTDLQLVDEDIAVLQTDYLVNQAIKYSIELPPSDRVADGYIQAGLVSTI